ncbi:MAG: hypothetical protein ACK4V6_10350 [Microthrixaceae bacterium]
MPSEITLSIETADGLLHRTILPALPLPQNTERGVAAESAIRFAAAVWGMPDFVFEPAYEVSGSGVREVGDGILIISGTAVMIQSKSRQQSSDLAERETNWLTKNITKGLKQAVTRGDRCHGLRGVRCPMRGVPVRHRCRRPSGSGRCHDTQPSD